MQCNKILGAIAIVGAVLAIAPAFAAEGGNFQPPAETFVGRFMSKTSACPSLDFHLTEATDKKLTGIAFDPMMSGQMSSLSGEVGADGKVHLTMTPMGGKGPAGAIDGSMQGLHHGVEHGKCAVSDGHRQADAGGARDHQRRRLTPPHRERRTRFPLLHHAGGGARRIATEIAQASGAPAFTGCPRSSLPRTAHASDDRAQAGAQGSAAFPNTPSHAARNAASTSAMVTLMPSAARLVTPCWLMPHGTMPLKCNRSGATFSATP